MAKAPKKRTVKKRVGTTKRSKKRPLKKKVAKRRSVKKKVTEKKAARRKPTSEEIRAWVANQIHASIAANQPEETADAYKAAAEYFRLSEKQIIDAEKHIEP